MIKMCLVITITRTLKKVKYYSICEFCFCFLLNGNLAAAYSRKSPFFRTFLPFNHPEGSTVTPFFAKLESGGGNDLRS